MKKIIVLLFVVGCHTPMPKPSGMLALDYPTPNYQAIVSDCPFDFDINSLSSIDLQSNCFFSLSYPSMKAKVYMSYFDLRQHNIDDLIKDFNDRLIDHTRQQARIQESSYESIEQQKYGRFFEITANAPSNLHYMVTDQKNHFISGLLFFSATPNYDSLYPAVQYIKNDLRQLTESLTWLAKSSFLRKFLFCSYLTQQPDFLFECR